MNTLSLAQATRSRSGRETDSLIRARLQSLATTRSRGRFCSASRSAACHLPEDFELLVLSKRLVDSRRRRSLSSESGAQNGSGAGANASRAERLVLRTGHRRPRLLDEEHPALAQEAVARGPVRYFKKAATIGRTSRRRRSVTNEIG